MKTPRPASRTAVVVATSTVVALLATAAPSGAAKPGLRLDVRPDAAAPEGRAPKAIFSLLGAVKGREYKVEAIQSSGQSPNNEQGFPVICTAVLGDFGYTRATGKKLTFRASPLTSYEIGSSSPCTGTYKGRVLVGRGSNVPRVAQTFTLVLPAMRLTKVRVPTGRDAYDH